MEHSNMTDTRESKDMTPQTGKRKTSSTTTTGGIVKKDKTVEENEPTAEITTTVVHCWSAPRSRSTALLYSFHSRTEDCVAIDEPLYRSWIVHNRNKVERPYTDLMIEGEDDSDTDSEWNRERQTLRDRILSSLEWLECRSKPKRGVIFIKHMAKHAFLFDFETNMEKMEGSMNDATPSVWPSGIQHRHVLLIRDPVSVLSSWEKNGKIHGKAITPDEVGIAPLLSIYSSLTSTTQNSSPPIIVDSDRLASDPKECLQSLCSQLTISYEKEMLSWPEGPKECDGPWAKWWYETVHKSTGWVRQTVSSSYRTMDRDLMPALRASLPAYEFLAGVALDKNVIGGDGARYEDERNADLLIWIGAPGKGRLRPREMAGVSPWDSSVQGGDAVWEGLRVYRGKILSLDRHLGRLFRSAKALGFENVHSETEVKESIFKTLAANGMRDGAHVRLTLSRGDKCTSSMNPKFNVYGTTLIILPEWKPTEGATTYDNTKGISLITAANRRNPPSCIDSKIHHNNLINNILPKIQANLAGAADAIMLDLDGFVSETNATNIFLVDHTDTLLTPHGDHCLPGITRETVLVLAEELKIEVAVRNVSLAEFHAAEEVFTTGTMGELTPVRMIDGRVIGKGVRGPITKRLQEAYKMLPERDGWATDIPPYNAVV